MCKFFINFSKIFKNLWWVDLCECFIPIEILETPLQYRTWKSDVPPTKILAPPMYTVYIQYIYVVTCAPPNFYKWRTPWHYCISNYQNLRNSIYRYYTENVFYIFRYTSIDNNLNLTLKFSIYRYNIKIYLPFISIIRYNIEIGFAWISIIRYSKNHWKQLWYFDNIDIWLSISQFFSKTILHNSL